MMWFLLAQNERRCLLGNSISKDKIKVRNDQKPIIHFFLSLTNIITTKYSLSFNNLVKQYIFSSILYLIYFKRRS